jgi:hypothetical protein
MIATEPDPKDGDFADQTKTGDATKVTSGADSGPPQNPSPNAAVSVASDAARPADAQTQLEATAWKARCGSLAIYGDLLALEAALLLIRSYSHQSVSKPRIVFLGDLFDDEGFGLEVLLRVFELILENPALVCVIAGNHDEALSYDGTRFTSDVSPSDFSEYLNTHSDDEWITRAGKLAVRLFSQAARALFFPDGLLVAHGGFPLTDLHAQLQNNGDWNNPACLSDFVWTRAHPTARKKIPNRFARGSQFGYEDFAAFCLVASALGRPVTHMVRGHDHVEQRFAVYPAYSANPILTTVALARRLPRELFGTHERAPTLALYIEGALPQVFRLHVSADLIAKLYPERLDNCNVQLEQSPA